MSESTDRDDRDTLPFPAPHDEEETMTMSETTTMTTTTPPTFPHLTPVTPTRERLFHCDLCHASEVDDIMGRPFPFTLTTDLRPMYRDERDGITVCLKCAEAGEYLVIETIEASEASGAKGSPTP